MARYRDADVRRFFRGDAAFANPDICTFLEKEDYLYAIRLPANQNLQRAIEHLLTRLSRNRPPKGLVAAKPNLKTSAGASIILKNLPMMVLPRRIKEMSNEYSL